MIQIEVMVWLWRRSHYVLFGDKSSYKLIFDMKSEDKGDDRIPTTTDDLGMVDVWCQG